MNDWMPGFSTFPGSFATLHAGLNVQGLGLAYLQQTKIFGGRYRLQGALNLELTSQAEIPHQKYFI